MRLARHVTLPMKDVVTFNYVRDCKLDVDLKQVQAASGDACRAAVTLEEDGRVITSWTANFGKVILNDVDQDKIVKALQKPKIACDFINERISGYHKGLSLCLQ